MTFIHTRSNSSKALIGNELKRIDPTNNGNIFFSSIFIIFALPQPTDLLIRESNWVCVFSVALFVGHNMIPEGFNRE